MSGHQPGSDEPENPFQAPESSPAPPPRPRPQAPSGGGDETVATIIPYRNTPALLSYYFGLFGFVMFCVPFVGLGLCVAALVLGIKGVRKVRLEPGSHGTFHAWFGVVTGSLGTILGLAMTILAVIGIVAAIAESR